MSVARNSLESLAPAHATPGRSGAPRSRSSARSDSGRVYLRRYAVQAPRPRYGKLLLALCLLGSLLFSKVWESTIANSLSMERERLRREVRALENRIRLSSELRDQAALREGIDSQTLRAQGFVAPDPARIIEIDLDQAMPRAVSRPGVVDRLGALLRRIREGRPAAPVPDGAAVPVRAGVDR
jgi:hypothetical protein